ncbi:MAG: hypothetical protein CR982_00480 [Candidatus Cloacimonadota bacterium]|nr:MAG: hypothetical protein CR982_00480 [Candidatus Cloacimonadota bacterium]PIE78861.1 MAG: hypothetical protein CSA15_05580 [Candidatus Delongbacteria bacterium]
MKTILSILIISFTLLGSDLFSEDNTFESNDSLTNIDSLTVKETPLKDSKATDEKGKVTYVDGVVKKKTLSSKEFDQEVKLDGKVKSKESYKTMIKSRAELELKGMDIIRLAPKTTIDLISLYEELLENKTEKTKIKLEEGDIWAQVNSSDEDSEFEFESGVGSAAITGTNFRVSRSNDGTTRMKVYHGEVKLTNSKNPETIVPRSVNDFKPKTKSLKPKQISGPKEVSLKEWVYIVKNMQEISFDKNGNVTSAGTFSKNDKDEKSFWVEWNRRRDRAKGLR